MTNSLTEPEKVLRDPLALAMLAAWLNVRVDQLPPEMNAHTCVHTMNAWKRVGEAALDYHQAQLRERYTLGIKGTYYDD